MGDSSQQPLWLSIPKDTLALLPAARYEGEIIVIDKDSMVDAAIERLKKEAILGFDTETRPSFHRGQNNRVSLIQLATPEICYLFRINKLSDIKGIIGILENPDILKIGLSIHDDFHSLNKIAKTNPQGFIDLQSYVKDYHIFDNSLSRIYGIVFGMKISKNQRLSNWEADTLTAAQEAYAALDAGACVSIFRYLEKGEFDPEASPYIKLPEIPEDIISAEDNPE